MEDFENDHGAIHDLAADLLFEVARLRRRYFMVDENDLDVALTAADGGQRRLLPAAVAACTVHEGAYLLPLTDAQIGCGVEAGTLLHEGLNHLETQRLGQFAQLGERRLEL